MTHGFIQQLSHTVCLISSLLTLSTFISAACSSCDLLSSLCGSCCSHSQLHGWLSLTRSAASLSPSQPKLVSGSMLPTFRQLALPYRVSSFTVCLGTSPTCVLTPQCSTTKRTYFAKTTLALFLPLGMPYAQCQQGSYTFCKQ